VQKALAPAADDRYSTAREMAVALENCAPPASSIKVGAWVESVAGASLKERAQRLREAEENTGINAVLDVQGLQLRLADARAARPSPESDGLIALCPPADSTRPSIEPSASTPPTTSPWRSRRRAIVLGLFAIGASLFALMLHHGREHESGPPSARVRLGSASPAIAAPEPVVLPGSDLTSQLELPRPRANDAASTTKNAPSVRPVRHSRPPLNRPAPACVPPYVLDAQGRKRFKPECF
jgi:hypothetical protein